MSARREQLQTLYSFLRTRIHPARTAWGWGARLCADSVLRAQRSPAACGWSHGRARFARDETMHEMRTRVTVRPESLSGGDPQNQRHNQLCHVLPHKLRSIRCDPYPKKFRLARRAGDNGSPHEPSVSEALAWSGCMAMGARPKRPKAQHIVNPSLPAMRAACAHDSVPRSSTSPKPCTSFSMLRLRSVQQTTAARARSLCACARVRSKIM